MRQITIGRASSEHPVSGPADFATKNREHGLRSGGHPGKEHRYDFCRTRRKLSAGPPLTTRRKAKPTNKGREPLGRESQEQRERRPAPAHGRPRRAALCSCRWWALRASIPRPSPCKGGALPTELSARTIHASGRGLAADQRQNNVDGPSREAGRGMPAGDSGSAPLARAEPGRRRRSPTCGAPLSARIGGQGGLGSRPARLARRFRPPVWACRIGPAGLGPPV